MVHANPNDFAVMLNPQSKNAENVGKWISEHMDARTDPASKTPGAPPLYGQDAVPHLLTYQSIVGSFSRAYVNPDEAMRDSIENAHLMEKDVGLLESVECRQRLTALLDWEIKPEDEKCQYQVSLAQELQRIISRIRNFTKYRMWLMKAIWSGRSGIQHKYGYTRVNGAMRMMPTPLHRDHNGWMPINGDKLVFRYEDGWMDSEEGAYPHQMGIRVGTNPGKGKMRIHRDYKLEPVSDGLALFLKPYERDTFCVHKHFIEDADFHHSYFAGSVHGIGIRSKIYWEWFLKQEAFAFLMQYLERSAGGIEVWTYPMGDPKALEATQAAAKEKMANGRNIVFFPKPMGDDSESYKFEVIEPGAMGLDIMQNIIENYFGGRLKRYILGQELSTEAKATGMGSGVAEAHMDTLSQIVQFDASNLEETLTHELVRYIQQLNFPETMGWHMRMSLKTKDDKTQERLEALSAAYQMGASIAESEVFKTLGLSAPTSGEKVLSMQSQQPAMGMPGMPGMPPMGGNPDGDNSGLDMPQGGGDFPDGENEDDGEQDPVDLIRSLMEQYAQQIERERYGTQGMFKWDETLHPRESSTDMVHKAGQFTSKKTAPQQKSLFEGVTPVAKQSSRFSGKPRSGRKALNDRIRSLFAEHAESRQKQLSFDDPVETPAPVPEPKPVSHRETETPQAENTEKTPVPAPEPPPLNEMARIAAGYQLHGMRAEPEDDRLARQHQKHMTKSALDNWLMNKFNIDSFTARGVSNAAGEMNPYTVEGSGTVGGTKVRWTHKTKEPSLEEIGETPWSQKPEPVSPPKAVEQTAPQSRQDTRQPDGNPPKRRMMGANPDSMKAVAQPAAPPVQPKPQPAPQKQADQPSVETVPQPNNQPAVAAQPVGTSEQVPTSSNAEPASGDVSKRNQLVTDNFHLVAQTVRMMQKQGWATRDSDAAESAAMDGLMKAAEKWDGSTDFATYAKNGMAQAIKNLNRRKMDKITSNQSGDDETDPLANVAGRSYEPDYGDDERAKLDKAISSLGNEQDQWLVKAWFSGEDEGGNTINQSQAAESYNSKFGQNLTRQAIGYRATQLLKKLQSQLASDPDQYAAVRNMIIRYYRREIIGLQKERYERRQDRTIREAAEYTETDPTDAQIKAGNYKKGRFSWNGMQIVIENPRGSVRRGVASNGEIWKRDMTAHYGYISGTKGTDGDQVDVFMGRNPESEVVFVICQTNKDGSFDEHKAILGTTNKRKACDLYLSHYPKGWKCGEVVAMTVSQFKEWLNSGECCHE
jgi:phage gp29-like protein